MTTKINYVGIFMQQNSLREGLIRLFFFFLAASYFKTGPHLSSQTLRTFLERVSHIISPTLLLFFSAVRIREDFLKSCQNCQLELALSHSLSLVSVYPERAFPRGLILATGNNWLE